MDQLSLCELSLEHESREFNRILGDLKLPHRDKFRGKKIGILVGSRGICNLRRIISKLAEEIKSNEAECYIIPAMGSHGGGTIEGQIKLLENFGLSRELNEAKIISSEEYIDLGRIFGREPVVVSSAVADMDYLVGINKIRPHPIFNGKIESGLLKLISVGLGSLEGSKNFHRLAGKYGFENTLMETSKIVLSKLKFLCLIGIIEDRVGSTFHIEAIKPSKVYSREEELLEMAKKNMPSLPFYDIDLLVVNQMGKNYSGSGVDICVVGGGKGKKRIAKRIYVRSLSPESDGNAIGMGLLDFVSRSFFESIDFKKTYINALSSLAIEDAKVPLWFDSDKECIDFAVESIGKKKYEELTIAFIENTSNLRKVYVTPSIANQITSDYHVTGIAKLIFDEKGEMSITNVLQI